MPPVHKQNTNTEKNLRVFHLCEVACELALVICKITGGVFVWHAQWQKSCLFCGESCVIAGVSWTDRLTECYGSILPQVFGMRHT